MCVPLTGWLRWSRGSDPNQSRDCQVEKNIMASDPQALSKQRLYWHAEWSLDTHSCMCRTHTHSTCTPEKYIFYARTFTHCWHTRNFESNAHARLTRTCRACMQALSWHAHTCAHTCMAWHFPLLVHAHMFVHSFIHAHISSWALDATLIASDSLPDWFASLECWVARFGC